MLKIKNNRNVIFFKDYKEDKEKYLLAGETLMEFEAGLGTRVALDMELYVGVLESFGTEKYKHWY